MTNYAALSRAPSPSSINTGVSSPGNALMISLLGSPMLPLTQDDQPNRASPEVRRLITHIQIRGDSFAGIKPFIDLLSRVFARIEGEKPDLLAATGCAGILAVRNQRGSTTLISNHSWGTAIDFTFLNPGTGKMELNPQGSGKVQAGALALYEMFKADAVDSHEHLFWGAGFAGKREDAMHFEATAELLTKWKGEGKI